jgi:DNA adenine methylase
MSKVTRTKGVARPFLKWVGGKSRSVDEILTVFPNHVTTYYDFCVGGGAVLFAMASQKRFDNAVICDVNSELICTYRAIRDNVEETIESITMLQPDLVSRERYEEVRASHPRTFSAIAARMIYLNKRCFNGLYRVNRSGGFNVSFGKWTGSPPKVLDEDNLRACSKVLRNIVIEHGDFERITDLPTSNDAAYFDPPYIPISSTANFTSYTSDGFTLDDQERMAVAYEALRDRGVAVALSNSNCPWTRNRYASERIVEIKVGRGVSCKADSREKIKELLISRIT